MKLAQDEVYVLLVIGLIGLILFGVILYKIIIWGIRRMFAVLRNGNVRRSYSKNKRTSNSASAGMCRLMIVLGT